MRIAITGAGLTGLTAGYRLSKQGHQVTLFEKEKFSGGLAAGFRFKDWDWNLEFFFHHLFTSDYSIINLIHELWLSNKLFFTRPKTSIYLGKAAKGIPRMVCDLPAEASAQAGALFRGGGIGDPKTPGKKDTSDGGRQARSARHDSSEVNVFQFDSPFSLLQFPPLSFPDRLRTGLTTLYLKSVNHWQPLEKITAFAWLKKYYGEKAFNVLWRPLLAGKFGQDAPTIPMSWFWARIKKRSSSLGYIEGGFQTLIDKLVEKIKDNGGEIILGEKGARGARQIFEERRPPWRPLAGFAPQKISDGRPQRTHHDFDRIVITTPTQIFFPDLPAIKMLGAICLILVLKEKFLTDNTYWLNINNPSFPFVAVVEHTNFVDPVHYQGNHILYVGGYYPQTHRYFKMSKEQIFAEFLPFLQKINPLFPATVIRIAVSKNLWAQPVIPLNYSRQIPPFRLPKIPQSSQTPQSEIFLANMSQIYPWDRGTNYAVEMGEKIAKIVEQKTD